MQKVVLFDIDFTLFDAKAYRTSFTHAIAEVLQQDKEKFLSLADQAYKTSRAQTVYFEPKAFIKELLQKTERLVEEEVLEKIIMDENRIIQFLYDDVISVLKELAKDASLTLGVFSSGKLSIQTPKIKNVRQFFNEHHIHIYEEKKHLAVPKLLAHYTQEDHIYLIDDIPQILALAKTQHPNMTTILIRRAGGHHSDDQLEDFKPDCIISSLPEVLPVINK